MIAARQPSTFRILWKTFLEQFAANESATSEIQMRRAIIGVITFLVTPGFFLMMRTMSSYELLVRVARAKNMPGMIETHLAQMAVLFVSYSMVTTGLLTVFIWDTLVFDKRDAMVLGPMPIRGKTIVAAKLAALGTFLLGTSLAVNVLSGVSFGVVTGATEGHIVRHLFGHLAGTVGGAVFVFSSLVIVRGVLVAATPQFAATAGSFLQFVFLSGVLCFMMLPTAMGEVLPPISWFVGLFEATRGSRQPIVEPLARLALIALPLSVAAAVAVTFSGYSRQMRAALAPSARVTATARLRRGIAWVLTTGDSVARGTAEFVLTTLARNRAQQTPVAIAAAIGVAIASVAVATRPGGLVELQTPRTVVLWIPMVLGYWIVVGLRASFVLPSELPAAWLFRVNLRLPSHSYWSGVRAAMIACVLGPALAVHALVVLPLVGWRTAAIHAVLVTIAVVVIAQFASLLVGNIPFTRAYPPGHAKLKTRWPLYLIGMYLAAYAPVQMELRALNEPTELWWLFGEGIALIGLLELLGRRRALTWQTPPDVEDADPESLTVLNIGPDVAHA